MAVSEPPFASEPSAAHRETPEPIAEDTYEHPETQPIIQEQLIEEVRGIYAGLVMVEKKCIEIDEQICKNPRSLSEEQWQATIALRRTLLREHHDLFLASQPPSSSAALRRLATEYAMPARMWRYGISAFLELLRHRLPDSLDHMRNSVYTAYSLLALLVEAEPSFVTEWTEILGDLARYRMVIEDADVSDREIWSGCAQQWYTQATHRSPNFSMTHEHLMTPNRATITRRPQQIGPERQFLEGVAARRRFCAQYYSPEFFQGQLIDDNEEMLDMPPTPDLGGSKFEDLQFLVPEGSSACAESMLDTPPMPEISASSFDVLPSASRSYSSEGSSANSAPNESILFRSIGDNYLNDTTEDKEMPDINFDGFLLPETPEPPLINPLNNLFNPETTFLMHDGEPETGLLLEEHYLTQESDWNFEFDVHMVRAIVEYVPGTVLSQKPPVTVEQKADDGVRAEKCADGLCNSEKRDDQATSNSATVKDKYDTGYTLQMDNKPIQNFSTAPDHDFGSLLVQIRQM